MSSTQSATVTFVDYIVYMECFNINLLIFLLHLAVRLKTKALLICLVYNP